MLISCIMFSSKMFKSTFSNSNQLPDFPVPPKDRGVKRAVAVRAESSLLDQAARDFTVTFYAESLGDTDRGSTDESDSIVYVMRFCHAVRCIFCFQDDV